MARPARASPAVAMMAANVVSKTSVLLTQISSVIHTAWSPPHYRRDALGGRSCRNSDESPLGHDQAARSSAPRGLCQSGGQRSPIFSETLSLASWTLSLTPAFV